MASSSCAQEQEQEQEQKFQVFLSFRGEDTRVGFTSHLHAALKRKGIDTYVDYRLEERGEQICEAIEESKISIIVLSKNYASSSWCLDELSKILECKKTMGQKVVPIFYHVDPSDVRGSFEGGLEKWRGALVEVGGLSGFHLRNDRLESEVIEEIADHISNQLMGKSFVDIQQRLVGIESRVDKIESMLCFHSKDVRILGIWGMGGIGKTTIAEAVFNRFVAKFEGDCFVNVSKELDYRQKLFSELLGDQNLNVDASIIGRLQHKKILFVLDDVNDSEQLDLLSLKFGPGSRIIVTSRDRQLIKPVVDEMYRVGGLFGDEALQLFSLYAFGQKHPKKDFVEFSMEVVRYVEGLPLALRVFGSSLYGKTLELWKGDLEKLKEISNPHIHNILRISYDRLDEEVKGIFLDIACFFNLEYRDYVEDLLDACYISAKSRIWDLINRSLLTISNDDKIMMHNLLRLMALNIIQQESNQPGQRSRLWTPEDICPLLEHSTGTDSVKGMVLDMSKISRKVCISPTAFARMKELKFLKFYYSNLERERERKVFLEKGLESLPGILTYLRWDDYPSESFPSNFCPENLVELCMPNSHLERLWGGVQNLVKLQKLDLCHSQYLINIPDLSQATNLKDLMLNGCSNITKFPEIPKNLETLSLSETAIEEVPSSIGDLSKLKYLYLCDCKQLERLPSSICKLKFLEILDLGGCFKFESFPEISETMERIIKLDLSFTSIKELPLSFINLVGLTHLDLHVCEKLKNLPQVLPPHLELLDAHKCRSLKEVSSALPISHEKKQRFRFTQCLNLHQNCINWVKTPLSIQQRATEDVKLYHEKVKLDHEEPNLRSSLSIYFHGSKIPEWFSSKRLGSSVTIQLPPHWHDDKFLGFAVCAVLYKGVQFEDFNVSCRCNFKSNDNFEFSLEFPLCDELEGPRFIGGDNVVLGYDFDCYRAWYKEKSEHHLIETSFEFSDLRMVKECGVCLLYAQDEVKPDDQEEQKHPNFPMASSVQQKLQVFLSFGGEDTRFGFTSHLYAALQRRGIDIYIDDSLERGEEIFQALSIAIEESKISIIVLSKNYASSSWCLDELSKILKCKQTMGQKVVPIFYHVDPSDVQKIRGSFKEGFEKHQQRFKDNIDKVERWKNALVEVASLSGFHLRGDRLEYEVVEEIAEDISKELIPNPLLA